MAKSQPNCLICGSELVYTATAEPVVCCICGKEEMGSTTCTQGHYVCNSCHRGGGIDFMKDFCSTCESKNAAQILIDMMNDKSVYPNGPEHHSLVGAAIITAYYNAGGKINGGTLTKDEALKELETRSLQVPGGTCGYWGCCGAATSAGQALSIILGSTPLKREEWGHCQRITGTILTKLADIGGPRCCKRSGFTAVLETSAYLNECFGAQIEIPKDITCTFCGGNKQCLRQECPYFPKKN